jgi:hypothetical protein
MRLLCSHRWGGHLPDLSFVGRDFENASRFIERISQAIAEGRLGNVEPAVPMPDAELAAA